MLANSVFISILLFVLSNSRPLLIAKYWKQIIAVVIDTAKQFPLISLLLGGHALPETDLHHIVGQFVDAPSSPTNSATISSLGYSGRKSPRDKGDASADERWKGRSGTVPSYSSRNLWTRGRKRESRQQRIKEDGPKEFSHHLNCMGERKYFELGMFEHQLTYLNYTKNNSHAPCNKLGQSRAESGC